VGRRLLAVDCQAMVSSEVDEEDLVTAALREALLQDAAIYWRNTHLLLAENPRERRILAAVCRSLEIHPGLILLSADLAWMPDKRPLRRPVCTLELPKPEYEERLRLWRAELSGVAHSVDDEQLTVLAGKFRLTGRQVRQVAAT